MFIAATDCQLFRTDHNELGLTLKNAQKFIPHIPKYFDEPFAIHLKYQLI